MPTHSDHPAFPQLVNFNNEGMLMDGLTIREHFAACALQGVLANPSMMETLAVMGLPTGENSAKLASNYAVEAADALIAELNKC